jgi:hypothetical protein
MYSQHNNVNNPVTPQYTTTDLGSAAALLAAGFTLQMLDRETKPGRAFFMFDDSKKLQAVLNDYWSGNLMVDAKAYFESSKWLKSRIYNG